MVKIVWTEDKLRNGIPLLNKLLMMLQVSPDREFTIVLRGEKSRDMLAQTFTKLEDNILFPLSLLVPTLKGNDKYYVPGSGYTTTGVHALKTQVEEEIKRRAKLSNQFVLDYERYCLSKNTFFDYTYIVDPKNRKDITTDLYTWAVESSDSYIPAIGQGLRRSDVGQDLSPELLKKVCMLMIKMEGNSYLLESLIDALMATNSTLPKEIMEYGIQLIGEETRGIFKQFVWKTIQEKLSKLDDLDLERDVQKHTQV